MFQRKVSLCVLYNANTYAVFFVCFFIIINLILQVNGFNIYDYLPHRSDPDALYNGYIYRGYAFSTEPGITAFYLNVLGPLAIWNLFVNYKFSFLFKYISLVIYILAFILTFSAAGFLFIIISLFVTFVITKHRSIFKIKSIINIILIIAVLVLLYLPSKYFNAQHLYLPIVNKITLSENSSSAVQRMERWELGAEMFINQPFLGYGPGYFSSREHGSRISTINWFLMILVECGLISFVLLMLFFVTIFISIIKLKNNVKIPYLIGFICAMLHLSVISTFYHPFLWFLLALYFTQSKLSNLKTIKIVYP